MNPDSHTTVTENAFDILASLDIPSLHLVAKSAVAEMSRSTDCFEDMEFVNVQGGWWGTGRDDPHKEESGAWDDEPHYTDHGRYLTAYNHFIDIKKGSGIFDDFDGYSYCRGSASKDQFQDADDALDNYWVGILSQVPGYDMKVDEGLMWWFSDEYVHAPGQLWYKGCSPAVGQYSYFRDRGQYDSLEEEAKNRFPLAASGVLPGGGTAGIPHSVFMPVDNLARHWYTRYIQSAKAKDLGPVMHAIQDAAVPHHAAGLCGNWHGVYEGKLDSRLSGWYGDGAFVDGTISLFDAWNREVGNPPTSLAVDDWNLVPARNWRIDMLVTWLALHAYRAYSRTYNHFRDGFAFNGHSAKALTQKATAMSMLVLAKAHQELTSKPLSVQIVGPSGLAVKPAHTSIVAKYHAKVNRPGPGLGFTWTSNGRVLTPSKQTTNIQFDTSGHPEGAILTKRVAVQVTDEDSHVVKVVKDVRITVADLGPIHPPGHHDA